MSGIWLATEILQWIVLLFLVVLNLGMLRYLASLREQTQSRLPETSKFKLGEQVSNFALPDIHNTLFATEQLFGHNTRILLLFLNSGCGPCKTIVEQIEELAQRSGGLKALKWNVILICIGEVEASQKMVENLSSSDLTILLDKDASIAQQYKIPTTPFGMAIDGLGNLYSQSFQPASMWLYSILDVPAPSHSTIPFDQHTIPVQTLETLV